MKNTGSRAGWFLLVIGVLGCVGAIYVTATASPGEAVGRLQLPSGVYGPVLAVAAGAVAIVGLVVILRSRKGV